MSINYPGGLDSLNNPAGTDFQDATGKKHAAQHANANDAIEALEAKVGVNNSGVASSLEYKVRHIQDDDDPLTQYQLEDEKDQPNGYPGLDGSGLIDVSEIPDGIPQTSVDGTSSPTATLSDDLSAINSTLTSLSTSVGNRILTSAKDAANGVAGLDAGTKLKLAEMPFSVANGVAKLDASSLLTAAQVPFGTVGQLEEVGTTAANGSLDKLARIDHTHTLSQDAFLGKYYVDEVGFNALLGTNPFTVSATTNSSAHMIARGATVTVPSGAYVKLTATVDAQFTSFAAPHATLIVDLWVDGGVIDGRQILFTVLPGGDEVRQTLTRTWTGQVAGGSHWWSIRAWMLGSGDQIKIGEHTCLITEIMG